MNYKLKTYKAFTLVELLVAIGLLAIVISFTGVIFRVSINSHRTAIANAEIMQKLRAITDQLNADFKGLRKDAPLFIWFQQDPSNPDQRYDQIMFFADGDFQSIQLYDYYDEDYKGSRFSPPILAPAPTGLPIRSNVARIYYGQAISRDSRNGMMRNPFNLLEVDRVLARNQHILTEHPDIFGWFVDFNALEIFFGKYPNNDFHEHDKFSLSEWKLVNQINYKYQIIPACFNVRSQVDIFDPNTFHNLISEGLGSFAVQFGYWDPGRDLIDPNDDIYRWFSSNDPDGDPTTNDSHFLLRELQRPGDLLETEFGVYFNTPELSDEEEKLDQSQDWYPIEDWYRIEDGNVRFRAVPDIRFSPDFYPDAMKFTFKLYDSKGIIKEGSTFTHIVYLDN